MAACLVNITGSTGEALIEYVDSGSVARSLICGLGSIWLDDGGSDYTFTTLTGDATVTSLCISFTEVVTTCYILSWERPTVGISFTTATNKVASLVLGNDEYTLDESIFPRSSDKVCSAINALNLTFVKAVAYKIVSGTNYGDPINFYMILKVQGTEVPFLKIKNNSDIHHLYIKGSVSSNCLPAGYTEINTCSIGNSFPL